MSIFDLHMHSTHSVDGDITCKQLIEIAKSKQLQCVALCDHNTVSGVDEFLQYANEANIKALVGIEFSTSFEDNEVHILGYNIDHHKPHYKSLPQEIQALKNEAGRQLIHKFNARFHLHLDEKTIMEKAKQEDSDPYMVLSEMILSDPKNKDNPDLRPYFPGGNRSDPATVNLYWDYCVKDCDCFIPIPLPSPQETIQRIHEDGGFAILAHPWKTFYQKEDKLQAMIDFGIDGIEAYSNYHDDYHNAYFEQYCKEHNLLMSCGSDFHGSMKPNIQMGEYGYTKTNEQEVLDTLLHTLEKKRGE